jgi:hypothetical protein
MFSVNRAVGPGADRGESIGPYGLAIDQVHGTELEDAVIESDTPSSDLRGRADGGR